MHITNGECSARTETWQQRRRARQIAHDAPGSYLQFPSLLISSGTMAGLTPSGLKLYFVLLTRCSDTDLAKLAGVSPDAVQVAYSELQGLGLISRHRDQTQMLAPVDWTPRSDPGE